MSTNNEEENVPVVGITYETVKRDALTLLGIIREDLSEKLTQILGHNDVAAHILVSVVGNGVYVSTLTENADGKFQVFPDFTPESIYELWQLKQQHYAETPNKGAWFSVQFTSTNDGFIKSTTYNYDKPVYHGFTPDEWFTAPEEVTEDRKPLWEDSDYLEDLEAFPRPAELVPTWLR